MRALGIVGAESYYFGDYRNDVALCTVSFCKLRRGAVEVGNPVQILHYPFLSKTGLRPLCIICICIDSINIYSPCNGIFKKIMSCIFINCRTERHENLPSN